MITDQIRLEPSERRARARANEADSSLSIATIYCAVCAPYKRYYHSRHQLLYFTHTQTLCMCLYVCVAECKAH